MCCGSIPDLETFYDLDRGLGVALVYTWSAGSKRFSTTSPLNLATLVTPPLAGGEDFGSRVAISDNGTLVKLALRCVDTRLN